MANGSTFQDLMRWIQPGNAPGLPGQAGAGAGGLNFPTAPEAFDWAYGLPDIMQQRGILEQMSSPETMYQAMSPMLNQAFGQIGRSGLPSSSFADRMIAGTVAPLWAQQQQNMLAGWQNLGRQLPSMMGAYWTPPLQMAQMGAMPASSATPTTPYAPPPKPAAAAPAPIATEPRYKRVGRDEYAWSSGYPSQWSIFSEV